MTKRSSGKGGQRTQGKGNDETHICVCSHSTLRIKRPKLQIKRATVAQDK